MAKQHISNRIQKVASGNRSNWIEEAKDRRNNRVWQNRSFSIALRILEAIDQKGWSQKHLAREMGVHPQQVNKIVKGKENLTLATIAKIESVLGIALVEVPKTDNWQKPEGAI